MRRAALFLAPLVACGGPTRPGSSESQSVEGAALPHKILRGDGGQEIGRDVLVEELAGLDVICLGESHDNPHHHWAQLELVGEIAERGAGIRPLALGMEMFQRPYQGVLNDYAGGKISDGELLSRSGWEERWGYDWKLYRPVVRRALEGGASLLALNVSTELRKRVSELGIDGLSAEDRARLPEMDLEDGEHRAWFDGVMGAMSSSHGHEGDDEAHEDETEADAMADRIYSIQVLWDETMADTAARWLVENGGQVVILAGNGHCHRSGIPRRLERRGVGSAASVQPIIDDGDGELSALLAEPESEYIFVMYAGAD